jgi:hypothetical protein
LANNAVERDGLSIAGRELYARRFSIEQTTRVLRERLSAMKTLLVRRDAPFPPTQFHGLGDFAGPS